jgi:hypothetical protein
MNRNSLSMHPDKSDVAAIFWSLNLLGGFIFIGLYLCFLCFFYFVDVLVLGF